MSAPMSSPPASRLGERQGRGLLLLAVLLIAANLRTPVTSVGAVVDLLQESGVPTGTTALLTSLPVLCFALVGALGMSLARRIGTHRGLGVALGLLSGGLVVRVLDGPWVLAAGTLLACSGIALANVLLPPLVKELFPERVGLVTGAYSATLSLGAAMGAALTVPIAHATDGWRGGLLAWVLVAVAALVAWAPYCRSRGARTESPRTSSVLRSPLAWALTVVFGLQSLCAYVVMSWVPSIFSDAGFSHTAAGLLLALLILVGVPVFFGVPVLATRSPTQTRLVAGLGALSVLGFLGLGLAPAHLPWLWAVLLGVGGGVFPLTLTLFGLRAATPGDTAALSAMGQSVGYLIAAPGPFLLGMLRDGTGSWLLPCLILVGVNVVQMVLAPVVGRARVVGESGCRPPTPTGE